MTRSPKSDWVGVLLEGRDLTLATLQPDGAPQATVVSYASDGADIFFGCGRTSQKAQNLARDPRVAITITLPYGDWAEIRGLSISGVAQPVADPDELARIAMLFMEKFPEIAQYVSAPEGELAFFRVTPRMVSVLDYSKGFGHTEMVRPAAAAA